MANDNILFQYITADRSQGVQQGNDNTQINYFTTIQQSSSYQALLEAVEKARERTEKYPSDQDLRKELQQAEQELNSFIESIRKLLDDIDKIPLNTERGKKAKAYFEKGNYQAAREILGSVDISHR
ncbi:hypothetical protein [Nitrosomonas sp.]|uniref:hypothetical protein n=1 Tax=Nitrosomonas sp. TaxID=42353 RepID=UPI00374D17F6